MGGETIEGFSVDKRLPFFYDMNKSRVPFIRVYSSINDIGRDLLDPDTREERPLSKRLEGIDNIYRLNVQGSLVALTDPDNMDMFDRWDNKNRVERAHITTEIKQYFPDGNAFDPLLRKYADENAIDIIQEKPWLYLVKYNLFNPAGIIKDISAVEK